MTRALRFALVVGLSTGPMHALRAQQAAMAGRDPFLPPVDARMIAVLTGPLVGPGDVTALLVADNRTAVAALRAPNGQLIILKTGDHVAGWQVMRISRDGVLVQRDGSRTTLLLPMRRGPATSNAGVSPTGPPALPTGAPSVVPLPPGVTDLPTLKLPTPLQPPHSGGNTP